jgi:hypothetical protein
MSSVKSPVQVMANPVRDSKGEIMSGGIMAIFEVIKILAWVCDTFTAWKTEPVVLVYSGEGVASNINARLEKEWDER